MSQRYAYARYITNLNYINSNINATIKVYVVNWEEIDTEDVVWGDPVSSN